MVWFGAVDRPPQRARGAPVVVTVAGSAGALPGTSAVTVKVTPYAEYPPKGRATGGVRCHRFLKGEDLLVLAWAGTGPARGAADGSASATQARPRRPPAGGPDPRPPGRARACAS